MAFADGVRLAHWAFAILNVIAPFTASEALWRYHAITMPFLYLHWITNDDTCALTLLESKLRGVPSSDSLFHQVVAPVYNFDAGVFVWVVSIGLWIVSMVRFFR